ncbi:MAG: 4Fe-4S binding protein [Lentisphaerae bacterium]|nr:4Fe-4S binding protein [Lentisphaerota bacterium]
MKRKIVHIDREKCNGCGKCVHACHEGAIQMVDGKAELVSDIYCDGLGDCLSGCPVDAITIEEREAADFDPAAVAQRQRQAASASAPSAPAPAGGCPGSRAFAFAAGGGGGGCPGSRAFAFRTAAAAGAAPAAGPAAAAAASALTQWPVQLRLVPVQAPWWEGADLLLAADCVAIAVPGFHDRLLKGRKVAVLCPKLDATEGYVEKLAAILAGNAIRSLTVARMHVPCCGGIVRLAEEAVQRSGKAIPMAVEVFDHTGAPQG